jgi:hypothetical protein
MIRHTELDIIKQVGANGQVCLGKEYSGKQIQISKLDDGTLIIKTGKFIPTSEQWLYFGHNIEKLDKAVKWAENNKRRDNFQEIVDAVENE